MTSNASTLTPSPPSGAPPVLRLSLEPTLSHRGLLDGGWWPRSQDPVAELPSLITDLSLRFPGVITRIALNMTAWDPAPGRLVVDGRIVRLGRFRTLDTHMISVTRARQDANINLLVIPPESTVAVAVTAMAMAADRHNTARPSDILAASRNIAEASIPVPSSWAAEHERECCWETEGGRICDHD
jgi:hypothetical protein